MARAEVTWRAVLEQATRRLSCAGAGDSRRNDGSAPTSAVSSLPAAHEARRMVEQAAGCDGGALWAVLDRPVSPRAAAYVEAMVARRLAGEPLQYVLGAWGFRRLDLKVDRRALIPRPETEVVVDRALEEVDWAIEERDRLPGHGGGAGSQAPSDRLAMAADLGTGSGAIALSLAVERSRLRVWASDLSPEALALARANLAGLGSEPATRVALCRGDWFAALPTDLRGALDVIVSNPPYVGDGEDLPSEVADWEPALALRGGPTGIEILAQLIAAAPVWLARPGSLVLELAPAQAGEAVARARAAGARVAEVHPDLAGRPRVLVARW
ncbi:MAG: peptide chain release factor N(5)-glutamine methyltransferase [Acidimicrobiales bacterium]